ncbi:BTAD domain-containing putative transcriptional regulator [Nocardia sp. NPDC003482]|uniref:BTAD domain-containing putative transcriptional regulator n=1 Tax=Nocardia sp. NPDC004068 TaxID=3364303 RepID=UPI0036BC35DA
MINEQNDLGAVVRRGRRRVGLTQHEVASRAHISVGGLRDIEQNRVTRPRSSTLRRLAVALELSPAEVEELVQLGQQGSVLASDLRLQVIGPLEVWVDGARIELNSDRQRTLLSLFVLNPGATVSVSALADAMSDGKGAPAMIDMVRTQVSRLRRRLQSKTDGPSVLVATPGGYTLRVETNQLDILAFRKLADNARRDRDAGRLDTAVAQYRQAIGLWRGTPLSDLPELQQHAALVEINREIEAVLLEYAETAAEAGRHSELLVPLRRFVDANPLHEIAHARLMTALANAGQRAEALRLFETLRTRLADELGIDPDREVSDAYLAILCNETDHSRTGGAATPIPTQLPADIPCFAGRDHHLAHLDSLIEAGPPDISPVIALQGLAGVGKTALATHWAHRAAGRFADGHLYADLGADGARDPNDILGGFLIALGVPPLSIPRGLTDRVGLYRSMLSERQMLIVLDDARHAQQVRPLLPGSPGCAVLVTSRYQMRGLITAAGAHSMVLDVMSENEARILLHRRIGSSRAMAEAEAAETIIQRCGGLPLALSLIATRAVINVRLSLTAIAEQLAEHAHPLDVLVSDEDTTDLRTAFASTCDALSREAVQLLTRLGGTTDRRYEIGTVSREFALPADRVAAWFDELARVYFVAETMPGRYQMHPLVHAYAAELAADRRTERAELLPAQAS